MFELVLVICIYMEGGEICTTEVSPNDSDLETCKMAGDFAAKRLAWEIKMTGNDGRVGWGCRRREAAT